MKNKFSTIEINYIKKYYKTKGTRYIAEKLNRNYLQIRSKVEKLKLTLNKGVFIPHVVNVFKVDEKCFIDITRPEEAYILGFLWADGYFHKNKSNSYVIKLEILESDSKNILKLFKLSGKWGYNTRKRKNRKRVGSIICSNSKLFNFLTSLNYTSFRNDSTKAFDFIPNQYKKFWLRGYFDGDGCAYYNKKLRCRHISFSGSYNTKWNNLIILFNNLDIKCKINRIINNNGNKHSKLRIWNKNSIENFYKYLYDDRIDIGLERKRIIIEKMWEKY